MSAIFVKRLENKYMSNPEEFCNLYSMVKVEVEAKKADGSSSCTNGLLWLTRYVVVDEAHAYKGAFGCHVDLILRKVRRLCAHGDQLLPLSAKYPLFVSENLGAEEDGFTDHIFYTLHDPLTNYQCQIPELLGRRIRGYYHGWVILSDHPQNVMWSLWNPVTSNMIHLPPLILKDEDSISIGQCCLLAPPDDPTSILLLSRTNKPTFVFYCLDSSSKKLTWTEISYAEQLQKITGEDGLFLSSLACCNKKLYAFNVFDSFGDLVIQVNIVDNGKEVLIKLLLLGASPFPSFNNYRTEITHFLKGSCTELFYITVGFLEGTLIGVYCFKLDMTSLTSEEFERFKDLDMTGKDWKELEDYSDLDMSLEMWERIVDLKDAMFFVDLAGDRSVYYRPAIASELGGIHIRDRMGQIMYSCNVKNNTISLSSMPSLVLPTSHGSVWECRLEDGHGEAKCTIDSKQEEDQRVVRSVTHNEVEFNGWHLLNLPVEILEMIMEHCVGVEYMNFRATCKRCHLATPPIKWSTKTSIRKLQAYSLVSPWLMVADKNQGVMTFTDPILGNNCFKKTLEALKEDLIIHCSRFGWLLLDSINFSCQYFFNPLTGDLRMLPEVNCVLKSLSFSAPPTSPDCMVVGFSPSDEWNSFDDWNVFIHYVAREPSWRKLCVGVGPYSIRFPTFLGPDLYALRKEGELIGFRDLGKEDNSWMLVEAKAPINCCKSPAEYFLMNCDQDLLLVVVGKFGEGVEVFKLDDSKQEWVKVNSVGKHMIYICGITCLCVEAKSVEMENKIYFPQLHSKSNTIVFYSLETCSYQTSDGDNIQEPLRDFIGTTYHLSPHSWIEPSWSS